ncbi:OLC1v1038357C1 [Oldenlandia corymbosa var. corymbosa]|uniref:OLC1v1038357C1 n=1 Tax=Oldenlandia corymbosa var. corymbosa TaxID=529605 RepID=A0AAV1D0T2_OLDCO|nr:OLC1v1038357C1 [Oldenlandia corymbosa var. corymbosa]
MAVAEARAAWQRTVNRCLVQEDAKRAPKLACCPSASPSSTREVDIGLGPQSAAVDTQATPSVVFLPLNWNASYSNLSPSSRWWLQLQPSHNRPQRGFIYPEDSEMKTLQHEIGLGVKCPRVESEDTGALPFVDDSMNDEPFINSDVRTSNSNVKSDYGFEKLDFKPIHKGSLFESSADINKDGNKAVFSKKTEEGPFPYSESPWIDYDDKMEPWWRIADEDELALLVTQRSFGLIENCDLPQPQNASVKRQGFVDHEKKTGVALVEPKLPAYFQGISNCNKNNVASEGESQKQCLPVDCQKPLSTSTITSLRERTTTTTCERDSSKAELLEALRHSQTRAREAERSAKQAYEEKEHVVKLVFKQASQLFAYKQWFQLLQLENLCYQIRNNKTEPFSSLFPIVSPWMMLQKPRRLRKNRQKGTIGKCGSKKGRSKPDICKYAVVFALGLSLVGAGLLLGWTVGWMLPTF